MINLDDVISYCDDMIELIKTPYETKGFENKVKSSYIQVKNWLIELKELKSSDNKSPEGNSYIYIKHLIVVVVFISLFVHCFLQRHIQHE